MRSIIRLLSISLVWLALYSIFGLTIDLYGVMVWIPVGLFTSYLTVVWDDIFHMGVSDSSKESPIVLMSPVIYTFIIIYVLTLVQRTHAVVFVMSFLLGMDVGYLSEVAVTRIKVKKR